MIRTKPDSWAPTRERKSRGPLPRAGARFLHTGARTAPGREYAPRGNRPMGRRPAVFGGSRGRRPGARQRAPPGGQRARPPGPQRGGPGRRRLSSEIPAPRSGRSAERAGAPAARRLPPVRGPDPRRENRERSEGVRPLGHRDRTPCRGRVAGRRAQTPGAPGGTADRRRQAAWTRSPSSDPAIIPRGSRSVVGGMFPGKPLLGFATAMAERSGRRTRRATAAHPAPVAGPRRRHRSRARRTFRPASERRSGVDVECRW